MVLANTLFFAVLPRVAVLLLVGAVEFEELLVCLNEMIGIVRQLLGNRAAELAARFLNPFDG